jgi:hypothetical protein
MCHFMLDCNPEKKMPNDLCWIALAPDQWQCSS